MNQFTSTPIPGTEGSYQPKFSPGGDEVVFWEPNSEGFQRVSLSGGDPFPVCRNCDDGSWNDDGHIYFRRGVSISRVPELGGPEELVFEPIPDLGLRALNYPSILPGGKAMLFEPGHLGEFAGVSVMTIETGKVLEVTPYGSSPIYSYTGHILFVRGNTLFAVPFDLDRLGVAGPEVAVLQGVRVENGGALQAAVSRDGLLVYAPADGPIGTELVWMNRQGAILERAYEERRLFYAPRISPDGQRVAVQINDDVRTGIWILDSGAGTLRLLATPADSTNPLWTNDGEKVVFGSGSSGAYLIQWAPADGSGEVETLIQSNHPIFPEAFSGDGAQLVFREDSPTPSLFVAELAKEGSRTPFLATEASEFAATLSYNGNWLAYVSQSSGVDEVYVRPFPGPGGQTLVSRGGGESPVWGPDNTELFYWSNNRTQMRVASLQMEPFLVLGEARLFDTASVWDVDYRAHYDITPDGLRFLMLAESENESRPRINIVLNWSEELKRLVPTDN
jgi:serine/threonine-protein kinase